MQTTRHGRWALSALLALVLAAVAMAGWWHFGRALEVTLAPVQDASIGLQVVGPGTVQARVPLTLSSRLTASVTAVAVDVGERVPAGGLLATLDNRDLRARRDAVLGQRLTQQRLIEAAEAGWRKAGAELTLARSRQQRDLALRAQGFVSEAGLDSARANLDAALAAEQSAQASLAARRAEWAASAHELAAAEIALGHARLTAPVDALVLQRLVEPGSIVVPGTPLLKLVDPASVWVAMRVDEAVLARVQLGQPARIRLRSGGEHAGQVVRVARQSDAATREIDVFVRFDTVPDRFAIDQEAEVTVLAGEQRGLRVPASALLHHRDGRPGVLRLQDGRAVFVPVQAGPGDGDHLLVQGALAAGELVVAPAAGVRSGATVRAAPATR